MKAAILIVAGAAVWVAAVGFGLKTANDYSTTAGQPAAAPLRWPKGSRLARASDRATLVMLAHPRCPCTRASLSELASLMARASGRVDAYVLFLEPTGLEEAWEKTALWSSAREIPGVVALRDPDG